jgi:hypothetical protein
VESILTDSNTSEELDVEIDVELRSFPSQYKLAEYLFSKLDGNIPDLERETGVWAWLTHFYFPELCPKKPADIWETGEAARWVPQLDNWKRCYRHLLAGPYFVYQSHRDDPAVTLGALCGPPTKPGDIAASINSRQELVQSRGIMEAVTTLYYDPQKFKAKRGAQNKTNGSARRFADLMNQLTLTWDLYGISADDLIKLLPEEFNRFRPKQPQTKVS